MRCWHHPLSKQDISVIGISVSRIAKCAILSWEKEWHRFLTKSQSTGTQERIFQPTNVLQLLCGIITRWDAELAATLGDGGRSTAACQKILYAVPIHSTDIYEYLYTRCLVSCIGGIHFHEIHTLLQDVYRPCILTLGLLFNGLKHALAVLKKLSWNSPNIKPIILKWTT